MKRVAKLEGSFNIVVEDVDVPAIGVTEILVRAECSLISRGSEIWRRYVREEAIEHQMMGYSLTGTVVSVGVEADGFVEGQHVAAAAPHAEYVAVDVADHVLHPRVVVLPAEVSFEVGTFWPLGTSCVLWVDETGAGAQETVVIIGQGLVGSGCMQVAKAAGVSRVVAIDTLPLRCDLARRLGADEVVDASVTNPVAEISDLTGGQGADVVIEAVGGRAGAVAFAQAQDMLSRGGLLQVLGLYENEPLPLDSGKIQGRRLVGGYINSDLRPKGSARSLELLANGEIQMEQMISHRFAGSQAAEAFDLLYNNLQDTMAVLLKWDE